MVSEALAVESIRPSDLPAPPQAALQIIRACSKESVNLNDLSKLAASDPILTAELLRVANSPYFGLGTKVQSIPRAVTVLGQRALRNLALCVSVRDAFKSKGVDPEFDVAGFWEDAIRRAVAARALAQAINFDSDDCFTAGLLQDFGILILFHLHEEHCHSWSEMRLQDPDKRYGNEIATFQTTHDVVGETLIKAWELPEDLASAIGRHHSCEHLPDESGARSLCSILRCADWMAALFTSSEKSRVLEQCHLLLRNSCGLPSEAIEELLGQIPRATREAAAALGLGIAPQVELAEVMRDAHLRLAEANLSYQELTWRLEKTLEERNQLQSELNKELDLGREIQQSLLPRDSADTLPIAGINLPARQLSGDFFDFFWLPDGRIYFNLGDVSGKGVNAALLMAKTSSLFRCLGKRIYDPCELLGVINDELCETSTRGMFVTICAGLYHPETTLLTLVTAGMPAVVVASDGKYAKIEPTAPPLGVLPGSKFPPKVLKLGNNNLYLYSDGATEGEVEEGVPLGIEGLVRLLVQKAKLPPQERLQYVAGRFQRGDKPLRDDLTLLVIDRNT